MSREDIEAYLYVLSPHSAHACNSQNETYCIEDVRLAATIETCDGIEALIPATDDRSHSI